MPEQLLTADDVARLLQLDKRTVNRYAASGQLGCIEVGGRRRFRQAHVDRFLERRERPAKVGALERVRERNRRERVQAILAQGGNSLATAEELAGTATYSLHLPRPAS